jgi:hypothetical protein
MITNFEEITSELNSDEQKIVQILVKRFREKPGRQNEITNKKIVAAIDQHFSIKTNEARIRKVINFIRINSLLPGLIATSSGYYLTANPKELQTYIQSLKEREEAIRAVRNAAEQDVFLLENSLKHAQKSINFGH